MCRTLIVEDNSTFRQSLREVLNTHFPRMSIEEAINGKDALQKVDTLTPDLIFMDIRLPDANGLELAKQIGAVHQDIVLVVLTSYDLPEYRDAAYRSGASYFFTKGCTTRDELVNAIEGILSTRHYD